MKVLFLNPPFMGRFSRSQRSPAVTKSGTLYYPVWLAYATGVLEKEGFQVKLIDAPARGLKPDDIFKIAKDFNPRLIVVDTSTPSIYNDVKISSQLKANLSDSFIVLVGTHVSALPDESLNLDEKIDAVARGEYDYTVRDLAIALEAKSNLKTIEGLSFKQGNTIIHNPDRAKITDIDEIPFASSVYKRHLDIKDYFFAASDYPQVQIFTARGCPFRCFFCVYPQIMHGHAYRPRSPQNVVKEFEFIADNLPEIREIVIEDDTFTINKERVRQICDLLIQKNSKLKWNANVRTDLDLATMQKMKQAGCRLLIVGFEAADQDILDNIRKGIRVEQIEEFFKNSKKANLLVHAAFMAGNPGETEETLKKTLKLAKHLMPDTVQFFPLMAYPGTEAFKWAKEHGLLKAKNYSDWLTKDGLHNCILDLPNLKAKKLVDWCDRARRQYYLSPRYLFYKLKQLLRYPQELRRTFKAGCQFRKYILRGGLAKPKICNFWVYPNKHD